MSNFVDEANIHVKAGDGGAGCVSFRREAHVPRGGPDGGDGGDGGDVWLIADDNVASLLAFADFPHRRASDGAHGSGKRKRGKRGDDELVPVPAGTIVRDFDGETLVDLPNAGDRWLAAKGGVGGRGNTRFASRSVRAPQFAEQAEPGEERWLRAELQLSADVALVGFPNAGKSTLISAVTAAKPKIGNYPFTTLTPNLGVVRFDERGDLSDSFEMVLADVPGLIEGAADGRGLGHQFLRHVQRASVLAILVDLSETAEFSPEQQAAILRDELARFNPELAKRPSVVVGTKADVAHHAFDGLTVSAVTGQGVDRLLGAMRVLVGQARESAPAQAKFVLHRPAAGGVTIEREPDGCYRVLGREALRAVALSDMTDPSALAHAQARLEALGVSKALARAGASEGADVVVGDFAFTYVPDEGAR